jgi:ubiquitin carboxyl-terminal hydrolase 8
MGNTCYMNCTLQCLSNTPLLKVFFSCDTYKKYVNLENKQGSGGNVVTEFGDLMASLWNSKTSFVKPLNFRKSIISMYPDFDGTDQHDVHEFLGVLIDILHEDLVRSNVPSLNRQLSSLKNPARNEMVS